MKNKNVIAIVAYNKPDLLHLYLEQIFSEPTINEYEIQIHTEEGYDKEQDEVIKDWSEKNPDVNIRQVIKEKLKDCPLPGFYNILSTYLMASQGLGEDNFVIVGEEDILPTKDYIRYNKYIYDNFLKKYPRILGAAHKRRPEAETTGKPDILIGDYQCTSLSVISVKAINKYFEKWLSDYNLYVNPVEYYNKHFFESRISPTDHTHHDGTIERIMDINKLFVLKPDQARSMHVGLSGVFCKGKPPEGTFEERVAQWRELIKDGDKLRSLSNLPEDLVVTDPEGPEWESLKLDLDRTIAIASSWWYDRNNEFKKYIESND